MNRFLHIVHLVAVVVTLYPLAVIWEAGIETYRLWFACVAWLTLAWLPAIAGMIRQWKLRNNG